MKFRSIYDLIDHMEAHGIGLRVDATGQRFLTRSEGTRDEAIEIIKPHLEEWWLVVYEILNEHNDGPSFRVRPRPYGETAQQLRERYWGNARLFSRIWNEPIWGWSDYGMLTDDKVGCDWPTAPTSWTACWIASNTVDVPQVGGMFSGCPGVPLVRKVPIVIPLPGATPPKGWKAKTKASPKEKPWRSESKADSQLPD